jgi:hypothetical protein
MPSKRQPSKQRRAAQNRAARSALAVRRENAARIAERAVTTSSGSDTGDVSAETAKPGTNVARPKGAFLRGHQDVPGGRAALLSVLFAVTIGLTLPWQSVPVDEKGKILDQQEEEARDKAGKPELTERAIVAAPAQVAIFGAAPALLAAYGFWGVRRRRPFRSLIGVAIALVLLGVYVQLMVPSALAFGFAAYQVRKAEKLEAEPDPPESANDEPGDHEPDGDEPQV